MSKWLVKPKLALDYMTYLSPIVTDVSLFEYCRTSTLVSRRSPISGPASAYGKITYQLDLKPTEKISIGMTFHTRIQCTYQQPALLIQDENCL